MNIVFAGTPDFAARHLEALLESPHRVAAVYTQPDRPAGRGNKLRVSLVKQVALARGLRVLQPETLRGEEQTAALRALAPDVMVVVAYGLILPATILAVPARGCINVHASLLPRWRGAAPVERAILAGDRETGVTVMQMDAGLDTGDILNARVTPISEEDTGATLTEHLAGLGREQLLLTLRQMEENRLEPRRQNEAEATYAPKLRKEEARIDWSRPAVEICRQVNALYPRMPAFSLLDGERIRILGAASAPGGNSAPPGTILRAGSDGLLVACGDGALRLTTLQIPGGKPLAVREVLNARKPLFAPGAAFTLSPPA